MRSHARVVIVGAGIMGLSTAWHLARRGVKDVLVVDRTYLCGGASGRNGGGVRAQFSSETNIRLMRESIEICREFAAEMGINVWFRQGGYLFLTRTAERAATLEESVALQNRCGLPTRLLDPQEAQRIVPELSVEGVVRASFNPRRRGGVPLALRVGLRQGGARPGRGDRDVHRRHGLRNARRPHHRGEAARGRRGCDGDLRRGGVLRGRVEPGDHPHGGRRAPQPPAPPRDLLDRAAQALARAAGRRPLRRAVFLAVRARRDRRGHLDQGRSPRG